MRKSVRAFLFCGVLIISACGGGSDSGGGGGSVQFTGTYDGTETITVTFLGESDTISGAVTITINGQGAVTVVDETGTTHMGNINNIDFTATGTAEGVTDPSVPGVTCNIDRVYVGSVAGNMVTGTVSGTLICNQNGSTFTVDLSGSFTATLSN